MTTYLTPVLIAAMLCILFWVRRSYRIIRDISVELNDARADIADLEDEIVSQRNTMYSTFNLLLGSAWHELEATKNVAAQNEQFEVAESITNMQNNINNVIKHYNEILSK